MLQNLHTHTTFCDGRDTPEEMISRAISKGFSSVGFSSHANTSAKGHCELGEKVGEYNAEILALKKKYEGKIEIFIGLELDRYSEGLIPDFDYDYKIGSAHMVKYGGEFVHYDASYEHSRSAIERIFGGDSAKYARLYYETLADMPNRIDFDFVGHFDLLTKYSEQHPEMIDTNTKEYRNSALEALHSLREKCEFFEVNTGAIGRGYRTTPYPAPFILDEMKALSCKLILSSDCHDSRFLDCHFDKAKEYLLSHGINELYYLTQNGFVGEKI